MTSKMPNINLIIPTQRFEIIRDRIGEILSDEINNQYMLANLPNVPKVWVGRSYPFEQMDMPAINVSLSRIDYTNKDQLSVSGENIYNIDVYTSSPDTEANTGDKIAMISLHKIVGMCRAIVENPAYSNVGIAPPFSSTSLVRNIEFLDPVNHPDTVNQTVGRIEFMVVAPEDMTGQNATPLARSETKVTLEETDKGYFYQYRPNVFTGQFGTQFL
jgi:hypothetical protein